MMRRTLAFCLTWCLLASFFALPQPPTLVCRISGETMQPVATTPETQGSCCAIAEIVRADGTVGYCLTSPGCCDLSFSSPSKHPAATRTTLDALFAVAWAPSPAVIVAPITREVAVSALLLWREAAPRSPPHSAHSPRGPPLFS